MDVRTRVGERVRELRLGRGWRQEDLAREARVTRKTVVNLENGYHQPGLGTVVKVAKALGVPPAELMG